MRSNKQIHSDAKDIELPKSESKVSDADERRQALRIALARRMKQACSANQCIKV